MGNIILEINGVNYGSTGNIMLELAQIAREQGVTVYTACPGALENRGKKLNFHIKIGNMFGHKLSKMMALRTGLYDTYSFLSTRRFIKRIAKLKITKIHLHNLHRNFLNLPMLFRYISENDIEVIWTFHDCWPITAQCTYYDYVQCDKWKTLCCDCPQSCTKRDSTPELWKIKKDAFNSVKRMTIVTPSRWMANQVGESYLSNYPCRVIYNGIDLNVFHPCQSSIRMQYHAEEKYIVLAVAMVWGQRKGLEYIIDLCKRLNPDKYQVIVVGTDSNVDNQLPKQVISIHRTKNQKELAEFYSAADVFANPTMEEALGLVNLEALACGTPVVTFNTGGSPETIDDSCGIVVPKGNADALFEAVVHVCEDKPFSRNDCIERAKNFDKNKKFLEYIDLYKK